LRLIASLLMFCLAACASTSSSTPSLNTIAEGYVQLALEINRHEDGFVDSYTGPAEWRAAIDAAAPRPTAELKGVADELLAQLERVSASGAIERRRVRYLEASISSARFRLDMIDGQRAPFVEEAERLFALRPPLRPLEHYDPIVARIATIAPGTGSLPDRIEAVRARYVVPTERVRPVMEAAIAECRRRTAAHIALPEGENFRLEFVTGQSWSAYNWYQGNNQSLIQVNLDLPFTIERALTLACHEGYPGHHVQGMNSEKLYRERGWVEFSVQPLYNPAGPLNEGGGNYGVELAFPGGERAAYERDVLYPLAGLDPATARTYENLRAALRDLQSVRLTIAQQYLDGEINRERAIELTQRYELASRARAEQSLDFIDHYRSYVINYRTGEDVVRAFVERAGASQDARWAAYESTLTQPTIPADLAP